MKDINDMTLQEIAEKFKEYEEKLFEYEEKFHFLEEMLSNLVESHKQEDEGE